MSHREPIAAIAPTPLPRSTPESRGVPSAAVLAMLHRWQAHDCEPHSVVVVRHAQVVAEGWWAPYRRDGIRLLYSVNTTSSRTACGCASRLVAQHSRQRPRIQRPAHHDGGFGPARPAAPARRVWEGARLLGYGHQMREELLPAELTTEVPG